MIETVIRKRIEILTDQVLVRRVTDAIDAAAINGWTVLPVQSGKGRDGPWREERVMSTDKVLVVTITNNAKARALAELVAPMLGTYGMLLTMWDVEVVRGELF